MTDVHAHLAAADGIVSASVADWSREHVSFWQFAPGRKLLRSIRDYQRAAERRGPWGAVCRWSAKARHRIWSVIAGAEIDLAARIGGGLLLPHPNGIVIHPDVEIGPNCLIFQQVTLGHDGKGTPVIGGHVDIGAGAKILGPVHIGDHARIGANAVVLIDVPVGTTAAGVPARIIARA